MVRFETACPKSVSCDGKGGSPHTSQERRIPACDEIERVIRQIIDDEYRHFTNHKRRIPARDEIQRVIRQIRREEEYLFRDDEYRHVIVDPDGGRRTVIGYAFS